MTSADPIRVIAIARSWLGTPYHDQASLRGVGCDCLGLARGVWREVVGPDMAIVTPGIRPSGSERGDQKRVMTPYDALRAGSTHLVVGRPIVKAPEPEQAAKAIRDEMVLALRPANR